jgi:coenzyme F420-0:L-glutamate ligase/coenzyme F420-1:gamma-L-glutamate ligase
VTPLVIYPVRGLPEIDPRVSLAELILRGIRQLRLLLEPADVVVVTQKIVSKAEGRLIDLNRVVASQPARELAERIRYDPRHVQVILDESVRVVREAPHVLITETHHGFVCANAGVDRSNSGGTDRLVLLPKDPDASAEHLRDELERLAGVALGVIISDSFGRPWREGQVNVAIGAAGVESLRDYRGGADPDGYRLEGTVLAVADELASAAELVMGKLERAPAALIRGIQVAGAGDARVLRRDPATDLFR